MRNPSSLPNSPTLHGGGFTSPNRLRAHAAEEKAAELLADGELAALLAPSAERSEIERARQMFVNRNLKMPQVELLGFDMDYTLAIYHMRRIEQLSFEMTVERLIARGYPETIRTLTYDHQFGMRGLVVDKLNGNIIKMDRFGHVGRAYHGTEPLSTEERHREYKQEPIRLKNPQFACIDTLFALPEACLFAGVIQLFEASSHAVEYGKLYDDIRDAIDTVHRDNSLKARIREAMGHYIFKDPELGPSLHKLRSGGKKLFLLTNSLWDYTDAVMRHLLDGVVAEYPSWRNYFDVVVTGASKPSFFGLGSTFLEVDGTRADNIILGEANSLERWKVYQGGNLQAFERMTGYAGEKILYVGDHIFGDILKSKKASLWRTCMVVQEIEDEIRYTDSRREELSRLSDVEGARARLDDEVNQRKGQLNALERRLERAGELSEPGRSKSESERKRQKGELDKLRRALRQATEIADALEVDVEEGFNPYWGLMFKEGHENSRFGEQVEKYACLYTSRVSNFLHYSPMQYFRSPRDVMAHERSLATKRRADPPPPEGAEDPHASGRR